MIDAPLDHSPATPRFDAWLAMAITLAVFAWVLATPYSVVDDRVMLRDNAELIRAAPAGLWKQLTTPQYNIYAPLTYGLWYLIAMLTSDGQSLPAIGFKIASWLAHGLGTMAAWWVIWQLIRNRVAALLGVLVVGLHPLQVESVAWTTGTKDVLCGALTFGAIALYLRAITGGRRRHLHWAVACGMLAVAAKPTGVVLPAILLAADLAVRSVSIQKRVSDLWPFLPASAIGVLIILNVQHATLVDPQPLGTRPLIALDSYSFYLRKIILPWPLVVDYGRTPEWVRDTGQLRWTWSIPLLACVAVLMIRSRFAWLACAIFVIPLLPVSGLVMFDMQQFSTVTDHYPYQSLLGVGILIAMVVKARPPMAWPVLGVMVLWASLSLWHLDLWRDPGSLYQHAYRHAPHGLLSRGALVTTALDRDDFVEAERILREVLADRPRVDAYQNLADVLVQQRRLGEAGEAAKKALAFGSDMIDAATARAWLDLARHLNDTDLALAAASHWRTLEPGNPVPRQLIQQINAARESGTRPASRPAD